MPRRDFLKRSVATAGVIGAAGAGPEGALAQSAETPKYELETRSIQFQGGPRGQRRPGQRPYNSIYSGERLSRIAFPMGGFGAGMICLEGTGALSHVSLRNKPEVFNEPVMFAAVCIKGQSNVARVLEGPVPGWKIFGQGGTGNGAAGKAYGLPRFRQAAFQARFPFAAVLLGDPNVPLKVEIFGWSPFAPGDADASSLPVAALEYKFTNVSKETVEGVFSFNARNFMATGHGQAIKPAKGGFVLHGAGSKEKPWEEASFYAGVSDEGVKVNHAWFRGGWWDPLTMAWKDIQDGAAYDRPPASNDAPAPGASLFVPFEVPAGQSRTLTLQMAWYSGETDQKFGKDPEDASKPDTYRPWYAGRFKNIADVAEFWRSNYAALRDKSRQFSDCFYDTTLPPEVIEAVAANLTILKSPTVLRQSDGRLWAWEGCGDNSGCCHGTCTHVWNYAQAIPHLFPALERTLRNTEFGPSQNEAGHQVFRAALPIREQVHDFHAAADGQLGGIMKMHRDWRISGDTDWLKKLWPKVKQSLDYCIETWDPGHKGVLEEPHHNTYDIEFWGPDGMCTSFYLGALAAGVAMGKALDDEVPLYAELLEKGRQFMESELWNGEYFIQKVQWEGLKAKSPLEVQSFHGGYSPEALELLKKEGPKYQYGSGCLSDGVLGAWLADVCGVGQILDPAKVAGHLKSIHQYNLKKDLSEHANPQRPSYALGNEGGLLLCTWPKGGELSLPFVYSNEVWTGIEYQVASHLMLEGMVEQGLEIVRTARDRYNSGVRNPFNEYECGHWYARAMASYGLIQGLTGIRYDAVEKTLYVEPRIPGDFRSFLATATGYGTAGVKDGKPFLEVKSGTIEVKDTKYAPKNLS
ncbi:MAG: hypothetical protein AMXMBFR13_31110 [Phycisphaerae bacterium]